MVLSAFETHVPMQQRDHYTSIEHFLDDDSFRRWVLSGHDQYQWEEWTVDNPERAKRVEEARIWLLAMQIPEETIPSNEIQGALHNTWIHIRTLEATASPEPSTSWYRAWWWVAASVLVVGIALGSLYRTRIQEVPQSQLSQSAHEAEPNWIEKSNTTEYALLVMLSDGSSVLLQPHSTLRYPSQFSGPSRKVYLSGDGFFEVSKNPKKPFYVYANELITKVVGTSFRIKAFTDQRDVEVVVRTGKVNVTSALPAIRSEQEEVLLLPNQGVRFARQNGTFEKIDDLTQEKNLTQDQSAIEKLSFEFTDVPVAQIFKTLEQAYRIKIDFPSDKLANCYLTTSLSDLPLAEKLKIICESLGRKTGYHMNENQITIQTNGCN